MAAPIAWRSVISGSKETLAFSVARFTLAPSTPSTLPRAFSTRRTHEAHVMPVTGISTSLRLRSSSTPPSSLLVYYTPLPYISDYELSRIGLGCGHLRRRRDHRGDKGTLQNPS